ncbi:uncharacterized protein LOC109789534 [Cajanus cajan]|uniref:uncharacterized protein LOC109789534 n=1 Tax=Cajanus cajan TaxID=3821 RepID=UPI00098DBBF5|nr:uncharacterized protein LOC109789534 [Cajanus cajan]
MMEKQKRAMTEELVRHSAHEVPLQTPSQIRWSTHGGGEAGLGGNRAPIEDSRGSRMRQQGQLRTLLAQMTSSTSLVLKHCLAIWEEWAVGVGEGAQEVVGGAGAGQEGEVA